MPVQARGRANVAAGPAGGTSVPKDAVAEWDVVDQASLDSFPASDPPGWGSFHAVPSAASVAHTDVSAESPPGWRHELSTLLRTVAKYIAAPLLVGFKFVRRALTRRCCT